MLQHPTFRPQAASNALHNAAALRHDPEEGLLRPSLRDSSSIKSLLLSTKTLDISPRGNPCWENKICHVRRYSRGSLAISHYWRLLDKYCTKYTTSCPIIKVLSVQIPFPPSLLLCLQASHLTLFCFQWGWQHPAYQQLPIVAWMHLWRGWEAIFKVLWETLIVLGKVLCECSQPSRLLNRLQSFFKLSRKI